VVTALPSQGEEKIVMLRRIFPLAAALVLLAAVGAIPVASSDTGPPTGERMVGNSSIEPAYNADTGSIIYLSTPTKSPFPTHTSSNAVSPLYLVEYPHGTDFGVHFNCEGIPGNCPDHDLAVAAVATGNAPFDPGEPSVYGHDPTALPGHDHLVDPPGGADFNVAWEVVEVLFTDKAHITHLTTEKAIDDAVKAGYAREVDLGFAFHCSVVSAAKYEHGTPVG
jgi:hypothetical protein